jgi:LysR family hydrogen peroxide-inducible transcriptional activator
MNLQQLEYVVAVDSYRHFGKAAEKCHVTQPTLSLMVRKLEDELGIRIFQRTDKPVVPTAIGSEVIEQARRALSEIAQISQVVAHRKGEIKGNLRLGIIPTLAPYLLPLFLQRFIMNYERVRTSVTEMITEEIIDGLKKGKLDAGLLVTPLDERGIRELPLFHEEFVAYVSGQDQVFKKRVLAPEDIDANKLWLLEEGHCFRSQILNLCKLRRASELDKHFGYEAGSIETLKKMVEWNEGITILPELALLHLSKDDLQMVRRFKAPAPVREVSLVTHKDFGQQHLMGILTKEILDVIPSRMKNVGRRKVVQVRPGR